MFWNLPTTKDYKVSGEKTPLDEAGGGSSI